MSGLYPGDARSLGELAKLAEEKEWTVLAALSAHANNPEALGTLASCADDWRAFAWMWAVLNPADPRHCQQLSEKLAAGLTVPENLRDAVRQFVLTPSPQPATSHGAYRQQADGAVLLRRAAQVRLLAHLELRKEYARGLARAVLEADEEGRYWPELRYAAFDVLGSSRRKAERSYVFERTAELAPRDRLRPLLGLVPPYLSGEEAEISSTLRGALPVAGSFALGGPGPSDYWGFARELAVRLEASCVKEILSEPWAQNETDRANFLGGGFVQGLGPDKLRALLASDLAESVCRHMIQIASAELSIEAQANLGRWTHANLDPEWSQPLRDRLSSNARPSRYGARSPHQEHALEALRDFALACDDHKTAADYAACLDPGEAPSLARKALIPSAPSPSRVGGIAGELLRRQEGSMRQAEREEAFREDVAEMLDLYPGDEDRALFLSGMLSEEPVEQGAFPNLGFLGSKILGRPESTRAFVGAGYGYDLVPAAYDADDPSEAFLQIAEAAIEHLEDDALSAVMVQCGWSRLALDRYRRFVAALRRRPDSLLEEAASALGSLPRPDAEAVPAEHLRMVLEAALDLAPDRLAEAVDGDAQAHLRRLLDQRDLGLRRLALWWARTLEPNEGIVSLLVEKKTSTRCLDHEFGEVLRAYAGQLAARAQDPTLDSEERAQVLGLARAADQEAAREAAFVLAEAARATPLRLAAAYVLAATDAHPDDEERLERLHAEEGDSQTRQQLAAALRNISSGTTGRALENLRSLVGLPEPHAGPRAFLPDECWDARFVECVDRARRNRAGDPGAYVGALITLAELLADVAIAERHYADPGSTLLGKRGEAQAAALRANTHPKPDHGDLIRRPNLTAVFPWFHQVVVLREKRIAHPAHIGSTEPVRVGDEDAAYAERLFRDIVEGWVASMHETSHFRS